MKSERKLFKDVWAKNVTGILNDNGDFGEEVEIFIYACEEAEAQVERKIFYNSKAAGQHLWEDVKAGKKAYPVQSAVLHIKKEALGDRDTLLLERQNALEQAYNTSLRLIRSRNIRRKYAQLSDRAVMEQLPVDLKKNAMFLYTWLWLERMDNFIDLQQHAMLVKQHGLTSCCPDMNIGKNCYGFFYFKEKCWKPMYNGNLYTILSQWQRYWEANVFITPIYHKDYSEEPIYKALTIFQADLKHIFTARMLALFANGSRIDKNLL